MLELTGTLALSFRQTLAAKHPQTLFLKTDVANAPWLVGKMSVKILPCLIAFVGGAAKDKCVGLASFVPRPGRTR